MLKGTYHHRIDAKGRLPVPAAFRRALGDGPGATVVVTLLDQCLAVYAPQEWARLEGQLAALPAFSRQVKALTRLLTSRAAECELDVQGRILLPPTLRQAAALERDAVVVGVLNRFEVWSPATWDGFVRDSERLLDDVSLEIQWPPAPAAPVTPVTTAPNSPTGSGDPQSKPNS
ncbi:MAG TPA: division/cell wall cluster transcriptional repressor MraZ [Vicinamibacteria bacterium]|nr:division/cell wall cluster transcriptional repressor MraZ [Vicinamibacteria bacterium]